MNCLLIRFLRVPSLLLAAALQVMPIVRAALPAVETGAEVIAIIFRWAAGMAAALGSVQAVAGASTIITCPLSTNIVEGKSFTLRLTTAPEQAHYWTATGLPAGLGLAGTSGQTLWQITGTPTVTGTFNVALTAKDQSTSGASRTVAATLVINISAGALPLSITGPPVSQTVNQGQSATFTVTATGAAPISYQWRFNASNLAGQIASSLVINPATTNNAGNYDVIASNGSGSVTSAVATLTVIAPPPVLSPTISSPPVSQTVTQGQAASFSVSAGGTAPLSYQWRYQGANISGQSGTTLVLNPATTNNAGSYDVIVSNGSGSVTSAVATLTVIVSGSALQITSQPAGQTVVQGQAANFSVGASGVAPLGYQWRFNNASLPGQTGTNLTIAAVTTNNAGNYDAIISNGSGSVTSAVATLTVLVPPFISVGPASLTVTQGQTATFNVQAGGTTPISFFWRKNTTAIPGASSASWMITNAQPADAGAYSVVVSNVAGTTSSAAVSLTVAVAPQPPPATVKGSYSGLFYEATGVSPLSSGSFTATVTAQRKYSASLVLLGSRYALSGTFDASGRSTNTAVRGSPKRLSVELDLDLAGGDQILGRVSDGNWSADLQADRAVWDARTRSAPQAGAYTLVIPGATDSPGAPAGAGFGTLRVNTTGRAQFVGSAGDGKRISCATTISKSGQWPVYATLYRGEGSVIGWLAFSNAADADLAGLLSWSKLQQPVDVFYPLGFAAQTWAIGSVYTRPSIPVKFEAQLQLWDGNLAQGITNAVSVDGLNRVTPGSETMLRIQSASGLFRGATKDPATGKPIPFTGVLLQKQNMGCGYFLGRTLSGGVYLGQ